MSGRLTFRVVVVAAVGVAAGSALPARAAATPTDAGGPYKCRSAGAPPIYQDQPCPRGQALRDFAQDPPPLSIVPFDLRAAKPAPKPVRAERATKSAKPEKRKAEMEQRRADADVSERRHVKEGMSDGEVLARLGPPDLQSGKTGRKMRWTYLPAPGDPQTVTLLRFEDGRVAAVERSTLR